MNNINSNSNTNNNNNVAIGIHNFKNRNEDNDININTITGTDNNCHNNKISRSTFINSSPNSTSTYLSRNINNINSNSTRLRALTTIVKVASTCCGDRRSNGYNYSRLLTTNDSHTNGGNNNSNDVISPSNLESRHTFSIVKNNSSNTYIGENVRGSRTTDTNLVSSFLNFITIIMIRTTIARVTRQIAKYVMHLRDNIAPTDIEETMRVGGGVDRNKYKIQIPLPPKIDASVTMMSAETIQQLRKVVEMALLHPKRLVKLGIDPPKCVLLYHPGTDATVVHVVGSELVEIYVSECARVVRELF